MSECVECGSEMPPGPGVCANCGVEKRVLVVSETEEVSEPPIGGKLLGELRRGSSGRKRRALEMKFGPGKRHGTDRLVSKSRLVDRNADLYHERIHDAVTGELLDEDKSKLSEHRGHGSDKRRRAQR